MARFCDDSELEQVKEYVTNKEEHQEVEEFSISKTETTEKHVHVAKKVRLSLFRAQTRNDSYRKSGNRRKRKLTDNRLDLFEEWTGVMRK